jgi:hypothetical protein
MPEPRHLTVGADATTPGTPRDGRYAEPWARDPEGNRVHRSAAGWATMPAETAVASGATA